MNHEPRLFDKCVPIQYVGNPKTRAYMIEKNHSFAIKKLHRGMACPFLGFDSKCMIYETRPQICREYPQEGLKCVRELEGTN